MTPLDPQLRASDRDREAVAETLRTHHGDGRLDTDELQERIERCYEARTLGELDRLVADLPREQPAAPALRWFPWPLAVLPILLALAAMSALTGRHLIWLAIPVFILARAIVSESSRKRRSSWLQRS